MKKTIDEMNKKDNKHCMRAACGDDGSCTYEEIPYPDEHAQKPDNACKEWICSYDEVNKKWGWTYNDTAVAKSCVTDDCTKRECDPADGCQETDQCMVHTNDCFKLTCEKKGGKNVCVNTSLLSKTHCMVEICVDGKIDYQQELHNCTPTKCQNVECVFTDESKSKSQCVYTLKDAPDNDLCKQWKCDDKTGDWSHTPTCDDGRYCTVDRCWKGKCRYPEVSCDLELNMTGYPCFQPRCREAKGRYKCVRKLIPNAYIDICGRCIKSDEGSSSSSEVPESESSFGSESMFVSEISGDVDRNVTVASESDVDVNECTGAPPKPVLTEGLAAAAIALIILAAVIVGAGIAASGVIGTKTLIERAKGAGNQSAHSNPLFEDNEAEMTNPAFVEGGGM
jgi:hypothetical protein